MPELLCVGGKADGQWTHVDERRRDVGVRVRRRLPLPVAIMFDPAAAPSISMSDEVDYYLVERFRCDGEEIKFLRHPTITPLEVFKMLLRRYIPAD